MTGRGGDLIVRAMRQLVPHRLAVRRLMRACGKAALATLLGEDGWPYASLVTVATAQDGSPLLLLSRLSDHTRNVAAEPRVSLLFDGSEGFANPQEGPRATVLGRAAVSDDPADRARFLARHPGAALYAGFADFAVYRVAPARVHFVGGFARAVWLDRGLTVAPDAAAAMAAAEAGIVGHMNADHADAIDLCAQRLLGAAGDGWRLSGADADGCDLRRGDAVLRLDFPQPVAGPDEARRALVALVSAARAREP